MQKPAQKTVIFDIDGTLCHTNEADERSFVTAVSAAFAVSDVSTDWGSYAHSTDSGIIQEIVEKRCHRKYLIADLVAYKKHQHSALESLNRSQPDLFTAVPGAQTILRSLEQAGWRVGIATGACRESASFKLTSSGIDHRDFAFACADDAIDRADIIAHARQKLSPNGSSSVVYIGDGEWDYSAAKRLGIGFIGLVHDPKRHSLKKIAGIETLDNFLDLKRVIEVLERAHL